MQAVAFVVASPSGPATGLHGGHPAV